MELLEVFKKEAELFFVNKFLGSGSLIPSKQEKEFDYCLDLIFDKRNIPDKDYSKGIAAISKSYGQGKSFFFDVVHHMYYRKYQKQIFVKITAKELAQIYQKGGEESLLYAIRAKNLFIDDLGDEGENKLFSYSKDGYRQGTLNVMRHVMLKRYEMWVEKGYKTHLTTNLTLEAIAKNYDGRVADRIVQMCDVRDFTFAENGSFRQIKGVRKLTKEEVAKNWQKLYPKKEDVGIDKLKYLTDLANDTDYYIENTDSTVWKVVLNYMIELEFIKESDLVVSDELKGIALGLAKTESISLVNLKYRNAPENIKQQQKMLAIARIKPEYIQSLAKRLKTKELFLKLRKEGKFAIN